jgi:hypothetical protein
MILYCRILSREPRDRVTSIVGPRMAVILPAAAVR